MKFFSLLAGALALGSAVAAPFAEPGSNDLVERARAAPKYKLSSQPAKGKSGVWTDQKTGISHIYYGDDTKVHGSHVEYHNSVYPQHANKPFKLASGTSKKGEIADNRKKALRGISTQGKGFIRDEKPLASLSHGAKRTTVMKVPERESLIEAHMARIAKSAAKKNGGSVQLHDHRTVTGTGPLGKVLKKRDLDLDLARRGGILSELLHHHTATATDVATATGTASGADATATSAHHGGIGGAFDAEMDKWEQKMLALLDKVGDDIKAAGDDFVTAVEQLAFGGGHQLGSFFQGMHNFDAVEEAQQANGTRLSDDDLAQDQAAIDVYMGGYVNASKAIGDDVMNDFYKFTDLVLGASSDDETSGAAATSAAQDIYAVGPIFNPLAGDNSTSTGSGSGSGYNSTSTPANATDDCRDHDGQNATAASNARRAEVKLW